MVRAKVIAEDLGVVLQGENPGIDGDAAQDGIVGVIQGNGQRVQEGIERGDEHREHDHHHEDDNNIIAEHFLCFHLMLGCFYTCHLGYAPFLLLFLEQRALTGFVRNLVGGQKQDEVDDGFQQTGRSTKGEAALGNARVEDVGVDDVGGLFQHGIAHLPGRSWRSGCRPRS